MDSRDVLQCSVTASCVLWVGDVGYVTAHWEDLGWLPPQDGPHTDRAATMEGTGWGVVIPTLDETIEEEGLQEVNKYVTCQKNTVAQCIATGPIMYLCLEAEIRPGTRGFKKWWEKDVLDLEGTRMEAHEAELWEREGGADGAETEMDTEF